MVYIITCFITVFIQNSKKWLIGANCSNELLTDQSESGQRCRSGHCSHLRHNGPSAPGLCDGEEPDSNGIYSETLKEIPCTGLNSLVQKTKVSYYSPSTRPYVRVFISRHGVKTKNSSVFR
jgi:hypothetical protein